MRHGSRSAAQCCFSRHSRSPPQQKGYSSRFRRPDATETNAHDRSHGRKGVAAVPKRDTYAVPAISTHKVNGTLRPVRTLMTNEDRGLLVQAIDRDIAHEPQVVTSRDRISISFGVFVWLVEYPLGSAVHWTRHSRAGNRPLILILVHNVY
ncbi:hypothetical protein BCR34DRAFT_380989 [Clohesyomyces aquaticus]|uniref:Uncharacterized protein n=1 Tax=Clohesyomyces aquaticus TaxID=1231657 RepID=A0A1Y2A6A2_9PLEO|nr:hypothetical protein BCR34DRAFT_380989 [Clohesyomyces aquaticus]